MHDATQQYRQTADRLDTAIGRHLDSLEAAATAARHLEDAQRDLAVPLEAHAKAQDALAEARTRLQVLESAVGKSVAEVLAKLDAARRARAAVGLSHGQAEATRLKAVGEHAAAAEAASSLERALSGHQGRRDEAIGALQAIAAARLLAIALPDVAWPQAESWSATRGVELARQADSALAEAPADNEAWQALQNNVYSKYRELEDELMRRGIMAAGFQQGDLFLVSVTFQNSDLGVAEARSALIEEINARHAVLSANEKRIIENHLLGEVAAQIGERLHQAESMVERMNREVARCQTTAGMTLRFRWLVGDDAPAGLKEARALLMRTGTMRAPHEQAALASFLQGRIDAERAQGDAASWYQILGRALDYRSWHEFHVERQQDGKWVRLTKRTHGTGSGGEKAIALTVPQFAAAAAHYSSADAAAPRLILLDEAFVGVDKQVRSRAMGLISAFDLDFVMTSENEWGCYPTLPHVAIYQLSGRAGIDAVGITRFVWNGRERRRADVTPPPAAALAARSAGRGADEPEPLPRLGLDFGNPSVAANDR